MPLGVVEEKACCNYEAELPEALGEFRLKLASKLNWAVGVVCVCREREEEDGWE